jgi:hypothetical protein
LTKIAGNRPHGAECRRSDAFASLGERSESLPETWVARDVRESNRAANANAVVGAPRQLAGVGNAGQVDQDVGAREVFTNAHHEVRAPAKRR